MDIRCQALSSLLAAASLSAKAPAFGGAPNHAPCAVFRRPPIPTTKKGRLFGRPFFVVGRGGFEPPKTWSADLQSAPFGRSGIFPRCGAGDRNRTSNLLITNQLLCQLSYTSPIAILRSDGASGRNRTTDTGIFSPLLYRLSYRGIFFMSDISTTHKILAIRKGLEPSTSSVTG